MATARNRRPRKPATRSPASESYLALVRAHPLRPLRSDADLDEAIRVIDALLARGGLDKQEEDYLEALGLLVQAYEDEHVSMPEVSAEGMLRHLLDQYGKTLSQVAKDTGIAVSTLSAVLNGKRELTRRHIEKLAPYFGVMPAVFLA
jgi:HTH-type transcriptional regulator / antitoxin HigA